MNELQAIYQMITIELHPDDPGPTPPPPDFDDYGRALSCECGDEKPCLWASCKWRAR